MTEIQGDWLHVECEMFGVIYDSALTCAQVCEALKAVEGKAVVVILHDALSDDSPFYRHEWYPTESDWIDIERVLAVTALTIGKDCGKLRELWEWSTT
jgi:hypothetical protein